MFAFYLRDLYDFLVWILYGLLIYYSKTNIFLLLTKLNLIETDNDMTESLTALVRRDLTELRVEKIELARRGCDWVWDPVHGWGLDS